MRAVVFDKQKVKVADGNAVVIVSDTGTVVMVISQVDELIEILTAADGEEFNKRVALLNQLCSLDLKRPTSTKLNL